MRTYILHGTTSFDDQSQGERAEKFLNNRFDLSDYTSVINTVNELIEEKKLNPSFVVSGRPKLKRENSPRSILKFSAKECHRCSNDMELEKHFCLPVYDEVSETVGILRVAKFREFFASDFCVISDEKPMSGFQVTITDDLNGSFLRFFPMCLPVPLGILEQKYAEEFESDTPLAHFTFLKLNDWHYFTSIFSRIHWALYGVILG